MITINLVNKSLSLSINSRSGVMAYSRGKFEKVHTCAVNVKCIQLHTYKSYYSNHQGLELNCLIPKIFILEFFSPYMCLLIGYCSHL